MKEEKEKNRAPGIRWDLSGLYEGPGDPQFRRDLDESLERAKKFQEANKGRDIPDLSPGEFLRLLREYEQIQEEGVKPYLYASLLFSEDTQNDLHKSLLQQAKERWNDLENRLLFFRLALIQLPEKNLNSLFKDPILSGYNHAICSLRRFRKFTRGEGEEEIINRKNMTGKTAFMTLFDELTGSFTFSLTVGDQGKELTGSEMLALLYSPDRDLRDRAFRTFLSHYECHGLVLTSLLNSLLLDWMVEDDIRGYSGPMQRTLMENEISQEVVDVMMEVTEAHYSLAQEYFQIKACLLGLPHLKNTDLYAPLPGTRREIDFFQAQDLLLESFQEFHPLFGEIAREILEKRWIDAEVRKGKYGGAFCAGMTPALHPYLLMNFTGNLRDVLTLAHEMGHAVHFYMSRKQSLLNFDPPLTLAETASTFGEMIMVQALLRGETDVAVRQSLLCMEIEDIIATVFRQNVLTRFEQEIYRLRRDHLLTSAEISDVWWQANARLLGTAVRMIPEYRWGWSYIPHFIHSRFYCFSYVFGELGVLALFEKYQEEGESFLPRLIRLLESGSSASPDDVLRMVGLDIHQPEFWARGFQVVRRLLDELKSLGPFEKICLEREGR